MEHDKDKMAAMQAEVKELKEAVASMMKDEEAKAKAAEAAAEEEKKEAEEKEKHAKGKHAEEREEELMSKKAKAANDPMRKEMEAVIASARKPMVDKMLAASAAHGADEAKLAAQAKYLNSLPIEALQTIGGMLPDETQTPAMPAISAQLNADATPESDDDLLKEAMYG